MVEYQNKKFIDNSEITVEQWAEFVFDNNENHKPNPDISKNFAYHELFYPGSNPDSLFRAFGKIDYYLLPVIKEYFDTLNYAELRNILDFPISGISYEDAQAYCDWRTIKYNEQNTTHTKETIRFELPDSVVLKPIQELTTTNKHKREIPVVNFEGASYENTRDAPNKIVLEQIGRLPVKTKLLQPDEHGLFDLYGNVAEMTSKKGIAYGGSYTSDKDLLQNIYYTQPEPWLGFRCVGLVEK